MDLAGRNRFMDLQRDGSIVAVVVGHSLVADVQWSLADLADTSRLAEVPGVAGDVGVPGDPLFFLVGGYANRRSWVGAVRRGEGFAAFVDRRLQRMLAPTAVYLVAVAGGGLLIERAGIPERAVGLAVPAPARSLYVDGRLTRSVAAVMVGLGLAAPAPLVTTRTYPGSCCR